MSKYLLLLFLSVFFVACDEKPREWRINYVKLRVVFNDNSTDTLTLEYEPHFKYSLKGDTLLWGNDWFIARNVKYFSYVIKEKKPAVLESDHPISLSMPIY